MRAEPFIKHRKVKIKLVERSQSVPFSNLNFVDLPLLLNIVKGHARTRKTSGCSHDPAPQLNTHIVTEIERAVTKAEEEVRQSTASNGKIWCKHNKVSCVVWNFCLSFYLLITTAFPVDWVTQCYFLTKQRTLPASRHPPIGHPIVSADWSTVCTALLFTVGKVPWCIYSCFTRTGRPCVQLGIAADCLLLSMGALIVLPLSNASLFPYLLPVLDAYMYHPLQH